jgi:hypothetical protein
MYQETCTLQVACLDRELSFHSSSQRCTSGRRVNAALETAHERIFSSCLARHPVSLLGIGVYSRGLCTGSGCPRLAC